MLKAVVEKIAAVKCLKCQLEWTGKFHKVQRKSTLHVFGFLLGNDLDMNIFHPSNLPKSDGTDCLVLNC